MIKSSAVRFTFLALLMVLLCLTTVMAQPAPGQNTAKHPWMDTGLTPDARAEMVVKELTLDEKIQLIHGQGMPGWGPPGPNAQFGNGGAGFMLGIERLGIPSIQMSDAAYGVRSSAENGRYSTALPSATALASSWDAKTGCDYGTLIGSELRAQGYNMTLGGGVNLARELRNGRTFEYLGEDPVLAGTMVGNRMKCEQAQHVIGDIKHYAVNDQETGRGEVNAIIGERAMRETDLLAFEIGIAIGQPGAVMCSYNGVNGDYVCQNKHLLTDILKKDWNFKGFVVSDWGATHSTEQASAAGLDMEQPVGLSYGDPMKAAVTSGKVPMAELDEHARRVLRSMFAAGLFDYPTKKSVVDAEAGLATARRIAENTTILLKNDKNLLPLDRTKVRSIAIIGENADMGMISGGGSAQVDPPGAFAPPWQSHVWFPTSPLKAVKAMAPNATVTFDSGKDPAKAAIAAKAADVAIVFVHQWTSEDMDLPNLSLPDNQDVTVAAVAAANPKTIVVLETGTAVTMPWIDKVGGVLEAWYAGSKGADAVADILFGVVNPSAKLPMTFPKSEADLPHQTVAKVPVKPQGFEGMFNPRTARLTFEAKYDEGLKVGYKWYDAEKKAVLFPFGHGLSYTTFGYSDLKVAGGANTTVTFTLKNTGSRDGVEIAQVYAALPASANEPPKRLVGFSRINLKAGESRQVTVPIDSKYLSIYDEAASGWKVVPGSYTFLVGGSSQALPLTATASY
jgi:beta-glucosidase